MEKLLTVATQSAAREFESTDNGQKVKVKAVDLTLSDGINQFIASAYDKKAQQLIDHPIKTGSLINADLTFSVRTVKTEKAEFAQQSVRLVNYGIIVEAE